MDNKGTIDGSRKVEEKCIKPRAGDADLWFMILEELHELVERGIVVEVAHVKAHRTKKKKMTNIERFVSEGNEKADELAKAGAMLNEGFMAEARAETMPQERKEVYVALQHAASFHCLVEEWKDCEELRPKPKEKCFFVDNGRVRIKHRTEWCGKGSKYMKMSGRCDGPKFLSKRLGTWCRNCSGYARQRMEPKLTNCCRPEQMDTKEFGKLVRIIQSLEEGRVPAKVATNWRIELNSFEMEE